MKRLPWTLALLSACALTAQAQLDVGDTAEDRSVGIFDSANELQNTPLSTFQDKVIVAYFYTPW